MLQEDSSQHNNKAIDVIKLFSKNDIAPNASQKQEMELDSCNFPYEPASQLSYFYWLIPPILLASACMTLLVFT